MTKSTQRWKAFIINVIGSASEVPQAVHYLSESLSSEGLSILHISTYETEVFLVQEQDVSKACQIFKRIDSKQKLTDFHEKSEAKLFENSINPPSPSTIREGFVLQVLPNLMKLARLSDQRTIESISQILVS